GWGPSPLPASAPSGPQAGPPQAGPPQGALPGAGSSSAAGSPGTGTPAGSSPTVGGPDADQEDLDQTLARSRWAAVGQLEPEEVGDTTLPDIEPTPAGPRSRTARRLPDRSILALFTGRQGGRPEQSEPSEPSNDGTDGSGADNPRADAVESPARAGSSSGATGGTNAASEGSGADPVASSSGEDVDLAVRRAPAAQGSTDS